mmetsp:Transcript_10526/g.48333  ORF Transcript_10526/g.48333 Transcript_10526/m.48333 type:complete len:346 (-) Transcript_10526:448-1485(-)
MGPRSLGGGERERRSTRPPPEGPSLGISLGALPNSLGGDTFRRMSLGGDLPTPLAAPAENGADPNPTCSPTRKTRSNAAFTASTSPTLGGGMPPLRHASTYAPHSARVGALLDMTPSECARSTTWSRSSMSRRTGCVGPWSVSASASGACAPPASSPTWYRPPPTPTRTMAPRAWRRASSARSTSLPEPVPGPSGPTQHSWWILDRERKTVVASSKVAVALRSGPGACAGAGPRGGGGPRMRSPPPGGENRFRSGEKRFRSGPGGGPLLSPYGSLSPRKSRGGERGGYLPALCGGPPRPPRPPRSSQPVPTGGGPRGIGGGPLESRRSRKSRPGGGDRPRRIGSM